MGLRSVLLVVLLTCLSLPALSQSNKKLSINGFTQWRTGFDSSTVQHIPEIGGNPLTTDDSRTVVHVKFKVAKYGEVSFPINPVSAGMEAPAVDLHKSRFIKITYKSNVNVVLQLRQTGVHGGIQNHIVLPASASFTEQTIYFSSFTGGLKPLDLSDVAKFNLALLVNSPVDGYAELTVRSFKIHRYKP